MTVTRSAGPHYRIEAADHAAHLFHVTLTVPRPQAEQRLSLPTWIPGSYLVREFARHLQKLSARQDGKPVVIHQLDKATWQVDCVPSSPLVLNYEVYAFDNSVRTAWLDSERGFFNGTSLCLRVHGQAQEPHELELVAPRAYPHWEAATGLEPLKTGKRGFGSYLAADYDELADCPVEMGPFFSGSRPVAASQCGKARGATSSSSCGSCAWPWTRRHRLVPLKKPRWASSQAVRTELSKA